jgi:uncharacterized protein YndB with AHSA1/START domain
VPAALFSQQPKNFLQRVYGTANAQPMLGSGLPELSIQVAAQEPMEFFGTYLEVTPHSRLVWTNEEGDNGKTVTTVTFDENAGRTLLVVHDRYPSKEALDSGSTGAMPEALDQLDELLASLGSSTETK